MKTQIRARHSLLSLVICSSLWQTAVAQAPKTATHLSSELSEQEILGTWPRGNPDSGRTLGAFQETRIYRLGYRGFPGSRNAEMTVDQF